MKNLEIKNKKPQLGAEKNIEPAIDMSEEPEENKFREYVLKTVGKIPDKITNEWFEEKISGLSASKDSIELFKSEMFMRAGFCYQDLSECDLSDLSKENLAKLTFNSSTIWPSTDKMPAGFHPEQILARGKDPMLGIKELHQQGIDGSGITIAVIDKSFQNKKHEEYSGTKIEIVDLFGYTRDTFHANGVLSNLCGQNIGVAPGANVIHYNVTDSRLEQTEEHFTCLKDILTRIKNGEEIKAVNISAMLVDPSDMLKEIGLNIEQVGLMSKEQKEKIREQLTPQIKALSQPILQQLSELGCEVIDSPRFWDSGFTKCDFNHNTNELTPPSWNGIVETADQNAVAFVAAGKVIAELESDDGYKYEQSSSASWTIPQAVGMYTLALQQDPSLTWDQFVEISKKTSKLLDSGIRIAQPKEIIELIKTRANKQEN